MYLAIFGSIIACGCYLTLVGELEADKAAYANLLFPIVAVLISAYAANLVLNGRLLIALSVMLLVNYLMYFRPAWLKVTWSDQ